MAFERLGAPLVAASCFGHRSSQNISVRVTVLSADLWWLACLNPWTASYQPALMLGVNGPSAREDQAGAVLLNAARSAGRGVRHHVSTLHRLILTNLNHFPKFLRQVASGPF